MHGILHIISGEQVEFRSFMSLNPQIKSLCYRIALTTIVSK